MLRARFQFRMDRALTRRLINPVQDAELELKWWRGRSKHTLQEAEQKVQILRPGPYF